MGLGKSFSRGTVLAALLCGTAASADVTADQVWQSWVDYYAGLGQTITEGSRSMDGDTLVITDVTMAAAMPDGSFSVALPEVRLKELGDGRVEVTLPASIPIKGAGKSETGESGEFGMTVTQVGMTTIVSGQPEDMTYDFKAEEMAFKVDTLVADGKPVPVVAEFALKGNSGTYHMTRAAGMAVDSTFKADSLTFNLSGSDPEDPASAFAANGTLNGVGGTSSFAMPEGVDMTQMHLAIAAGLAMKADMTFGGGGYSFDIKDASQQMAGTVEGSGGTFGFSMSKDGLAYGATGRDAKISMSGSTIPFPVDVTYKETGFDFVLPVSKGDAAQPFKLLVKLVDLSVSDSIWGMVDPTSQLPHDPATVIVDLSGTAKMLVDIFDPANAGSEAMPGEVQEVSLNDLQVRAAGAELTGTGAAKVDNSAGMPKPVGAVDLKLVGANALIDRLVAMGLIPEDQAMGARMMMGMFGQAAGEDTLTSKIEFKEDGGIYANGQRIQ
jgi:hypothetical protein